MGIKVNHDGNATAGAFAAEDGSAGKRRLQEATALASTWQQASNAGNQQLRGASAPGAAPGRSSASLVHAPIMGAPATPLLPRTGGLGRAETVRTPTAGRVGGGGGGGGGDFFEKVANARLMDARSRQFDEVTRGIRDRNNYERDFGAGAYDADALDRKLGVEDRYRAAAEERQRQAQAEADQRALDKEKALIREKMNAEIGRDLGYRRNATAQQGDVNAQRQAAQDRKQEVIVRRSRGLPGDDAAWGGAADERDWGSESLQFRDEPQQPSAQPAPPSSGYEKARSEGRSYYGDNGAVSDSAPSGGGGEGGERKSGGDGGERKSGGDGGERKSGGDGSSSSSASGMASSYANRE